MVPRMLILALLAATADAAMPSWTWEYGKAVKYYLRTDYKYGDTLPIRARINASARASTMLMEAESTCLPEKLGKNTEMSCTFDYLRFSGTPAGSSTQADVDDVLKDWNEFAKPAKVSFVVRADGKITEFDIGGLERKTKIDGDLIEYFRVMFMRLYSPLDLPLAKTEQDWIRGWKDESMGMLLQLPFSSGTAGAGTLTSKYVTEKYGLYQVFTDGRATAAPGGAVDSSANGGLVDIRVAAEAWIDPAGAILFRGYSTDAERISSSAGSRRGRYLQQTSMVQRVESFAADHSAPISVLGQRAPKRADAKPVAPEGVVTVDFATLGMEPLFIQGMPQVAQGYELPVSTTQAFVVVNTDGKAEKVTYYAGYELLAEHVERGLMQARFPVKDHFYAVDVAVQVRP